MSDKEIAPTPAGASDGTSATQDPSQGAPAQQTPQGDEQASEDVRVKGALEKVEKANADLRSAVDILASQVQATPEKIQEIHEKDPVMANRIVEKLFGDKGIKTFQHLVEHAEAESLKETDPKQYEIKKQLADTNARLDARDEADRKQELARFCEDNGIANSSYDPNFQAVMNALNDLNPGLVKADYRKALERAHAMAFGNGAVPTAYPKSSQYSGRTPSDFAVLPNKRPEHGRQTHELASAFKRLGYKMEGF